MGLAYYNEIDKFAAEWLRNLIKAGHIAPGDVDERDIRDVRPDDLAGYTQCHFFAGIGGWSYALRLADWPDDRPAWSGSCPCQPFSAAGRGAGFADERHLWPHFHWLIGQCRPPVVFGEQVSSKDGLGWFDLVQADLEGQGYAVGALDACAAGVGAPHIRQRLWWVADAGSEGLSERERDGHVQREAMGPYQGQAAERRSDPWRPCDWLPCRDGKARPVEPGTFPLAHGISGRVGRLRAYGNAIVPQVAEAFIRSYAESVDF
jgi:DNA (cytosine-5)-methyltransferase 1